MNYKQTAQDILPLLGGTDNVASFTNCMTRFRVNVRDPEQVDVESIKKLDGVMGVVVGQQIQVVVGPGHAQRLRDAFGDVTGLSAESEVEDDGVDLADRTKQGIKAKQVSAPQKALRHIGNIFVPLIPGFVGCGLFLAIMNIIRSFVYQGAPFTTPWLILLASIGGVMGSILHILVGYNAAKEFGGSPVLGAIAGGIIWLPAMSGVAAKGDVAAQPLVVPVLNIELSSMLGGVLGVILAAFLFSVIEKRLRKMVPASFDLFLVPFLTILIGTAITVAVIMPVAAIIMKGITFVLVDVALEQGGVIGGFLLSALFLPLVMLGLHQGLTPVHADLIASVGYTVLLPILATAGAGQVGMALAILIKTKDKQLKTRIKNALPVGFLGVGEPLIYGVSLPLFYPFITACIGGGFGGAVIALGSRIGGDVGAIAIGPSGLVLLPLIANGMWLWYLAGLVAAYIGGFVLTYFFGYRESMLDRLK